MKTIEILIIGTAALAKSAVGGSIGANTCNGRSAFWINPSLCEEISTGTSKCSEYQILSTPYHDIYEVLPETPINDGGGDKCMKKTYDFTMPWEMTDDKVQSALTQFMVWASLTRDMEMQKDREFCDSDGDMPWSVQMCTDDTSTFKQVHRTQPILSFTPHIMESKFKQQTMHPMSEKEEKLFGLPREKGLTMIQGPLVLPPMTPSTISGAGRNAPLMAPTVGHSRINLSHRRQQGDSIAVDAMASEKGSKIVIVTPSIISRNAPLMSPTIGRVSRIYLSHGRQGENYAL